MIGSLNKLPIALSGLFFFPDERSTVNVGKTVSIALGFMAGIIYSFAQAGKQKQMAMEESKGVK